MTTLDNYKGQEPAWCPGCGNFAILNAFKQAMVELDIKPENFTIVSGIGQASKFPHYVSCHTFNGLHGRSLPVATGIKLANHEMLVIDVAGDGDCYGEGGNHFMHAIRRNIGVKLFVHNNQIYGLTKGQASPTSMEGMKTKNQPFGVLSEQLNPAAVAVSLNCNFVARSFAGDIDHLKEMIKLSINHNGFTFVDILQPCVTFNHINTYEWYKQRIYKIEAQYNPEDRIEAFKKSLEWGEKIPIGVIYKNNRPAFEEKIDIIKDSPLVKKLFSAEIASNIIKEFY